MYVIAGIGSQLNTFLDGGGIGTPIKTLLFVLGALLLVFAVFAVIKHAFSSPPSLSTGVKEGVVSVVAAILCLVPGIRGSILNGAEDLVNDVINTFQSGGGHNNTAPLADGLHADPANPPTITITRP